MDVQVSEVISNEGLNPLLVDFENCTRLISDGLKSDLKCEILKNNLNERRLVAYSNSMLYVGDIGKKAEDDGDENSQYNFLVIRSKKSDKVRLINLDHVILHPYSKKSKDTLDSSITGDKITNAELNKQFGSKKTKRLTQQREKMKLDIDIVKDQLEQTVASITTDDSYFLNTPEQVVQTESAYKPPINREASTVEDVYRLDELLPPNVLDALELEMNTILANEDINNSGLSKFCMQNLNSLKNQTLTERIQKKFKIIVYINYLLKFLITPAKNITRKYILCQSSKDINSHILDNFTISSGANRTRPLSMKDKLICYILVLAMIACDYSLGIEVLSADMKVGIKKIQEMARVLAFHMNGPKTFSLKLPLPAPLSNLKRKKR